MVVILCFLTFTFRGLIEYYCGVVLAYLYVFLRMQSYGVSLILFAFQSRCFTSVLFFLIILSLVILRQPFMVRLCLISLSRPNGFKLSISSLLIFIIFIRSRERHGLDCVYAFESPSRLKTLHLCVLLLWLVQDNCITGAVVAADR